HFDVEADMFSLCLGGRCEALHAESGYSSADSGPQDSSSVHLPSRCVLVVQRAFPAESNCVLAAMSFATPITKSSRGSEPVFVNELDSPILIGIASPVRISAVSDDVLLTVTVPLPAST